MSLQISARAENFPIRGSFVISRGAKTEAKVVVAEISDGSHFGRGECLPYPRYRETIEGVIAEIEAVRLVDMDRQALRGTMPAGAARNALDCALWDLEAKRTGKRVADICGLGPLHPLETAYTLSLGTAEAMAEAAKTAAHRPLLKLKLGGDGDDERILAVRAAAPSSRIIVDANEAWDEDNCIANLRACAEARVSLIEQPMKAGADDMLRDIPHVAPFCADENLHVTADLDGLTGKYDAVNVKLDKTGGLTEALDLVSEARRRGYLVMVGCMVGTSLAMAPAVLLGQLADVIDLDGPLLLDCDRSPALRYDGAIVHPPEAGLWG
ncbi:MAG TPA: N-acetyl-D-Glu racemase DgcA [Afifellaceae bacterium]|nr:N-acetyl-D-Glu racemase DgcA [Afifellaceae bacterium]